ncbi:hypothetical protein GCM10009799_30030 [Nocardiopsis rhodophaea]|uniref:Immunity protein 35 domain-containing protein n=1 Tax=Nocardiopsis rhodophaea TaxID=280238 RepID=A0ABN2T7B8_9ACTN
MSTHISPPNHPPPQDNGRHAYLTRLLAALRARGGQALIALAETEHPVLYVRHRGRIIPVVVVRDIAGGWWFIWGRSGSCDAADVEMAADHLVRPPLPPHDRDPHSGVALLPPTRNATLRPRQSPLAGADASAVRAVA